MRQWRDCHFVWAMRRSIRFDSFVQPFAVVIGKPGLRATQSTMSRAKTHLHPYYVTHRARSAVAYAIDRAVGASWSVKECVRQDLRSLAIDVCGPNQAALRIVWMEHAGVASSHPFRSERYAAFGEVISPQSATTKMAAERICRTIVALKAPGLVTMPAGSPRRSDPISIELEATAFDAWLRALVPDATPLLGGFTLRATRNAPLGGVIAEFVSGAAALEIELARSREDALFSTEQLSLIHASSSTSAVCAEDAARAVFDLGMRIELIEGAVCIVPQISPGKQAQREKLRVVETFQLSLTAPCGQACTFCCLPAGERKRLPNSDVLPFYEGLREAANRGARRLRINGIEPLRAPKVVDLVEEAQRCGYEHIVLKSSCRPLADRAFAERFMHALRVPYAIDVPLYGSTAEIHDRIVGSRGAFDEVMRAIANIRSLLAEYGTWGIETVIVPDNLDDLPDLAALAASLGTRLGLELPHPTGTEADLVYPRVVLPLEKVVDAVFDPASHDALTLKWGDVPLCVEWAHEMRTGSVHMTMQRFQRRVQNLGGARYSVDPIEFASDGGNQVAVSQTTPCPHQKQCYAAPACPASVYTLYAELIGLSGLRPLQRDDFATPHREAALIEAMDALQTTRS